MTESATFRRLLSVPSTLCSGLPKKLRAASSRFIEQPPAVKGMNEAIMSGNREVNSS